MDGELPVDLEGFVFPLFDQGQDFALHDFEGGNAAVEALAGQGGKLNFNHVEPGGAFGCEEELETLSQSEGFLG